MRESLLATDILVGGSLTGLAQYTEINIIYSQPATTALGPLLAFVISTCSRPPVLTVSTELAPLQATFAIDTWTVVNVLSEETYSALQREHRGYSYSLRPNNLHLKGVAMDKYNILGLGISLPPVRLDFYVISQFALLCDGLIGLPSLESLGFVIDTERRLIHDADHHDRALDVPTRLASSWKTKYQTKAPLTAAHFYNATPQILEFYHTGTALMRWSSRTMKSFIASPYAFQSHLPRLWFLKFVSMGLVLPSFDVGADFGDG